MNIERLVLCGYAPDEAAKLCFDFFNDGLFTELEFLIERVEQNVAAV